LKAEIDDLEEAKANSDREKQSLNAQLDDLRRNAGDSEATRRYAEQNSKLEAELKAVKAELEKLDKAKKDAERKLKKKFDDDLAEANDRVDTEKKKADRLDKKVKKLEDEIKKLRK